MKEIAYYLKKMGYWLLPYTCVLCGQYTDRPQDLCHQCYAELPKLTQACQRCATPLSSNIELVCGNCLSQPIPFDRTFALYLYHPPITKLIMNLKFGHSLVNARIIGELLLNQIRNQWYLNQVLPEVIIPVPLHYQRLKERGFNQAVEIARPIAKALHLPLETTLCRRIKHTQAQAKLFARQREENVKDAFQISENLPYQHVAVIDDVITTGRTIMEFCQTLKRVGIKSIDVWCCARPDISLQSS